MRLVISVDISAVSSVLAAVYYQGRTNVMLHKKEEKNYFQDLGFVPSTALGDILLDTVTKGRAVRLSSFAYYRVLVKKLMCQAANLQVCAAVPKLD